MSKSKKAQPRIRKGKPPKGVVLTEGNLRKKVLPHLLKVFEQRCAYSQRHNLVSGTSCLDIDHFNPNLVGNARNNYNNLMLATHLSNMAKKKLWPDRAKQKKGIRFLNPCLEQDYGAHLFEDPETHKIVSETTAGRFHLQACGLNDESYVWERLRRSNIRAEIEATRMLPPVYEEYSKLTAEVMRLVEILIPPIPPPNREQNE